MGVSSPLLSIIDAGVLRDQRWLIRNINLDIKQGEIITVIGPNGAGKSTLAKTAIGATNVSEGRVVYHQKTSIGYVPQKLTIDSALPLSVDRMMQLTSPASKQDRVEALASCGIDHVRHKSVDTLSGGELQRVLLARAILHKPDLLVLDEPVQGVDFNGEIELYALIKSIRDRNNCAVLMISHDLHIVMAETDTVLCLNGHICCSGAPAAVTNNPEYLKLFGKNADKLAIYQHHHDHQHLPDGRVRHADGSVTDDCHPADGHHHTHRNGGSA